MRKKTQENIEKALNVWAEVMHRKNEAAISGM